MGRPVRLGPPAPNRFVGTVNREELAWAAGFFDGEGSTYARKVKGYAYLVLSVHQVELENLQKFQRALGMRGVINGPYGGPKRVSPIYQWTSCTFEDSQAVMAMLWPFLTTPKREQYKAALKTVKENPFFTYSKEDKQSLASQARWGKYRANKNKSIQVN